MTLAGILKLYSKFLSTLQTNKQYFIMPDFPLSDKSNYAVEEFSAKRQRATSRGTITAPPKVRRVVGIPVPILHRIHSDPIPCLETVQSHFQKEGEN